MEQSPVTEREPISIGEPAPAATHGARVVVTGASGMLGSYLVGELLSRGYTRVTVMVRSLAALEKIRRVWEAEEMPHDLSSVEVASFNIGEPEAIRETFRGASLVFNCAASVSIGCVSRQSIISNNVELTRTVCRAALGAGVQRVVHVSSVAALSPSPSGRVDADSRLDCGPGPSAYAESKYLSELVVERAARDGLEAVTVNPVTILGYGHTTQGSGAIIPILARGVPLYPRGVTGWIDARDAARAMACLGECPGAAGRRFVLSARNVSYRDLIDMGCRSAGKRPARAPLPRRLALAASGAEKLLARIGGRTPLLTGDMIRILYSKYDYDGEEIKKYVNFEYSPLEETVGRLINIYLKNQAGR